MALLVTFATPVIYKTTKTGAAGGSISYSAGTFLCSLMDVVLGSSATACTVNAHYTTDAGDSGLYAFAYNPATQTLETALTAALGVPFPGVGVVLSFQ